VIFLSKIILQTSLPGYLQPVVAHLYNLEKWQFQFLLSINHFQVKSADKKFAGTLSIARN